MALSGKTDSREVALMTARKILEAVGAAWTRRHPRAPWLDTLILHLDQDGIRIGLSEARFREQPVLLDEITAGFGKRLEDLRQSLVSALPWTCLPFQLITTLVAYSSGTCKAETVFGNCAGLSTDRYDYFPQNLIQHLDREAIVAEALGPAPETPAVDWACVHESLSSLSRPSLPYVLQARSEDEAVLRVAAHILTSAGLKDFLEGRHDNISPFSLDQMMRLQVARLSGESVFQGIERRRVRPAPQ